MYLLGLRALGHEVFYIEDTGECVYDPVQNTRSTDPSYGTSYIHSALEPFGLGDRWAFVNYDGTYHGKGADDVRPFCADADLFLNLSGGSWFWRDEYARIPRKAFIDSDPAFTQLAIAKAEPWYVEFFQRFDHLFTFGSNIGTPASPIPTGDFTWHKTWQPVTLDDWRADDAARPELHQRDDVADRKLHGRRRQQGSGVRPLHRPARRRPRSPSSSPSTGRRRCCASTAGAPSMPWACRARSGTTAISSSSRARNSASPSTPTSRRARAGSAIAPSAISRRAVRRSCRTPAGPRTCRPAAACCRSRRLKRRSRASTPSTATTDATRRRAVDIAREHFDARRSSSKAPRAGLRMKDRAHRPGRDHDSAAEVRLGGDDDVAADRRAGRPRPRRDAVRDGRLEDDGEARRRSTRTATGTTRTCGRGSCTRC